MKLSLSEQLPSRCMTNHVSIYCQGDGHNIRSVRSLHNAWNSLKWLVDRVIDETVQSDPVVRYIGPNMPLPPFPFENLELEHTLESSPVHPLSSPLTVSLSLRTSMNTDRLSNDIPLRRWARVRNSDESPTKGICGSAKRYIRCVVSSEETPALKRSVFLGCCLPKIGYFLVLPQYWLTWTFEISILLPSIASRLTITTVKSPPLKFAIAQLQKPSPPTTKFYRGAESTRARWRQDL
ncbi:uncharacterized protein BT62DRAFT_623774 [Guyanagaster necrorhizus]|uniref:Uncharacterized protein n=1 Tax=Guyanagaster necrorhizus TaxID=856835 RepID=A0A9P7VGX8_9AGAR|nr:uncharacterized protein BT62DRAFT_623774 [Guyanagaster necrorhizus MCA 3950]KAG7440363.1 hypothetical protein BT62DRAFT_623774 [Guyanagaster necrorhizus MCA 3950]